MGCPRIALSCGLYIVEGRKYSAKVYGTISRGVYYRKGENFYDECRKYLGFRTIFKVEAKTFTMIVRFSKTVVSKGKD